MGPEKISGPIRIRSVVFGRWLAVLAC